MPTRRELLKSGAAASAFCFLRPLERLLASAGASGDRKSLVVIEMTGGLDGLSALVPFTNDVYRKARPRLAVTTNSAARLDAATALNPALEPLLAHFREGRAAAIQGVGYPTPDRSHFRSLDIWQSGVPERVDTTSGWLGRAAAREAEVHGLAARTLTFLGQGPMPLALLGGPAPIAASSLDRPRTTDAGDVLGHSAPERPRRDDPSGRERRFLIEQEAAMRRFQRLLEKAEKRRSHVVFPKSAFALGLERSARLIGVDEGSIHYLRYGNFDTHSLQDESLPLLLDGFATAVDAFVRELAAAGTLASTLVVAYSEFGRRVAENGSRGTDHGAAGPVFIFGKDLAAPLAGPAPDLTTLDDGDLRAAIDFRSIFRGVLGAVGATAATGALVGGKESGITLFA